MKKPAMFLGTKIISPLHKSKISGGKMLHQVSGECQGDSQQQYQGQQHQHQQALENSI